MMHKIKSRLLPILQFATIVLIAAPAGYGTADIGDVKVIGPEEIVFDWTTDRCDMLDIPDLPARAFRDADGKVQLIATHHTNRRMIGDTLDSVKRDCNIIMNSHKDTDPSKFNYSEWLSAVYTLDGNTIYTLVHNEYQGHKAGKWHAQDDFFDCSSHRLRSTQGHNSWYYQEWNGVRYRDMRFSSQNNQWRGSRKLCSIGPVWARPHEYEAARKWVSPITGTVTITGKAYDRNPKCGDGVIVKILKGRKELWSKNISNGDGKGYDFNLEVSVKKGEAIYFRVNQKDNPNCDATYFNPTITVNPCRCPSGDYFKCWYNAITFAKSTDRGHTYSHPEAPGHLVACVPYQYEADTGPWGIFSGSNIIYNSKDGYYYAMLHLENRFLQDRGTGVMRTKTLDDPKSWRAWDGNDFNVHFINPYTEPNTDPAKHICQPVSRDQTSKMRVRSLTFNTYFNKFILVGTGGKWDTENKKLVHGFYYSLSDDLIHWTPKKLIMQATVYSRRTSPGDGFLSYPSLIDPNDTSRNFEVTGRRPYLYYTRRHPNTRQHQGRDRDLVRVPIEFYKSEEEKNSSSPSRKISTKMMSVGKTGRGKGFFGDLQ